MNNEKTIPAALRTAFIIHCAADCVFAVPLMIFPGEFLAFMGWQTVDPVAARLVAAALFGIGIESYLGRNSGVEAYKGMLNLKVIWSLAAVAGIAWSLIEGVHDRTAWLWLLLTIFCVFNIVWVYWRMRISSLHQ
jgi:hypothetical protein